MAAAPDNPEAQPPLDDAAGPPPVNGTGGSVSELENAAGRVIEITNTLGATAADVQQATDSIRIVRRLFRTAAKRPERLAMAGAGMIAAAGVLALRGGRGGARPSAQAQANGGAYPAQANGGGYPAPASAQANGAEPPAPAPANGSGRQGQDA